MKKQWIFIVPLIGSIVLGINRTNEVRGAERTWRDKQTSSMSIVNHSNLPLEITQEITVTRTINPFRDEYNQEIHWPQAINTELGDDYQLSSMGPYNDPDYDALTPAIAFNSVNNQFLVVWAGSDDVVGEYEIWGQRVNATNGAQIGADFQISAVGPVDDPNYDATDPAVAYNSMVNEYMVVWSADHYADGDFEIYGRRINAATGEIIGSMVRVSVMGSGVDPNFDAYNPAIAYNSTDNQYLIVWEGDDDTAPVVNNEFEIWGKRLDANANWIDSDNVRISEMEGSGDANFDAFNPAIAYNSTSNDYMVVWYGDKDLYNTSNDEYEIWGQRLNAILGKMGASGFRISDMGVTDDPDFGAFDPDIAYNRANDQYLVVWEGDDFSNGIFDIFGQRLEANGVAIGTNDFVISNPGIGPNNNYDAINPAVTYDRINNEYFVVWQDDELGVGEFEIWAQRINAFSGSSLGTDTRLSDMGPDGNSDHIAQTPTVASGSPNINQLFVVWSGDNTIDNEFEIWAQRWTNGYKVYLPITIK